jgi:hypothetical protein
VRFTPNDLLYGETVADYVGLDSRCDPHALADFFEVYGVLWEAHGATAVRLENEAPDVAAPIRVGKGHDVADAFTAEELAALNDELRQAAASGRPFLEVARQWGFPDKTIYYYAQSIGVEPKAQGVENDPQYADLCDTIARLLSERVPPAKVRALVADQWPMIPGSSERSDYTRFRNTCLRIMEKRGLEMPTFRKKRK